MTYSIICCMSEKKGFLLHVTYGSPPLLSQIPGPSHHPFYLWFISTSIYPVIRAVDLRYLNLLLSPLRSVSLKRDISSEVLQLLTLLFSQTLETCHPQTKIVYGPLCILVFEHSICFSPHPYGTFSILFRVLVLPLSFLVLHKAVLPSSRQPQTTNTL